MTTTPQTSFSNTPPIGAPPPGAPAASDFIGEHWDVPLPAPVAAEPLHWWELPKAWVSVVFTPLKIGPRLAASDFGWALLALVLAGAISSAVFASEQALSDEYRDAWFRGPEAGPLTPAEAIAELGNYWRLWFREAGLLTLFVIGSAVLLFAASCVVAVPLMPYLSAGERRARLYVRALKLVMWSHVAGAVAVTLSAGVWMAVHAWWFYRWAAYNAASAGLRDPAEPIVSPGTLVRLVQVLLGTWALSVVLRLGGRYGGQGVLPEWAPSVARCRDCGYQLTGLTLSGRCPECGLSIAESAPSAYRLTTCDAARGRAWWGAALRAFWSIRHPRRFLQNRAIHRPTGWAVCFAAAFLAAGSVLTGLLWLALVRYSQWVWGPSSYAFLATDIVIDASSVAWLSALAWMGCCSVAAMFWPGVADLRRRVNVLCSTVPGLIWSALTPVAVIATVWYQQYSSSVPPLPFRGGPVVLMLLAGPVRHLWLFRRGLQATRYAPV